MSTGADRGQSLGYIRGFDGVRGYGFVIVLMVHGGYGNLVNGRIGLDLFFTLSGFLITALLFREYQTKNGINFKRFYTKRARRILPALVLMIYFSLLYGLLVVRAADFRAGFHSLPFVTLFTANWYEVFRSAAAAAPFAHSWSLSVEEQFYALWPLLVLLIAFRFARPAWLIPICVGGSLLALVSRLVVINSHEPVLALLTRLEVGTDTNADHILLGCALAVVVMLASEERLQRLRTIVRVAFWPAVAFLVYIVFFDHLVALPGTRSFRYPITQSLVAIMSTTIVGYLFFFPQSIAAGILSVRPLRYLGELSLGAYLYHVPLFAVAREWMGTSPQWVRLLVVFAATVALATVSYHLIEMPIRRGEGFLALPWRHARAWQPGPRLAAVAIVALVSVPLLAAFSNGYL